MRVLSAAEVTESFKWYENVSVKSDYVHADDSELFFTHPEAACIELQYPPKLEQLPYFARSPATIGYEEQHFEGALIWLTNWGVWNSFEEGIGYRILDKMNTAAGQPKSFEAGPGHRFRADELTDAVGMLMQPMIFAWDGYYLPRWSYGTGEFFLHISHHSNVDIVTRTKAFHDRVFKHLEESKYNPKPSAEVRKNRFCREA